MDTGIVGSNPAQGMDVVLIFLCCVVLYEQKPYDGLSPYKESYQVSQKHDSEPSRTGGLGSPQDKIKSPLKNMLMV